MEQMKRDATKLTGAINQAYASTNALDKNFNLSLSNTYL